MKNKQKIAMLMSLLMVVGLAAFAAAGQNSTGPYNQNRQHQNQRMGSGGQGMQHRQMGPGSQHRGGQHGSNWNKWSRGNQGNWNNMSPADRQKMQQEYNSFLKNTEGLRQELYQKNLELRNELGRQNPNNRKVTDLQNETARLRSRLYQKEQAHMEKMRQINPNMGRGHMGGGMTGPGGNRNMMMDPGANQGGMGSGSNRQ